MTVASANQFPQPTRPLNSYNMSSEIPSSTAYSSQILENENSTPSNVPHGEDYNEVVPPTMAKGKERKRKHELMDRIVGKVLDKYEKMLEKQGNREGGKSQSTTTSRGLDQHGEAGKKEKLERFKIRTVFAEEVVVKENEKKK